MPGKCHEKNYINSIYSGSKSIAINSITNLIEIECLWCCRSLQLDVLIPHAA